MAQASGKVLLFGEHAVVHGIPAIAAAIPAGVQARTSGAERHGLVLRAAGSPAEVARAEAGDGSRLGDALAALLAALPDTLPATGLELTSDLPFGAGLGSSAAIAVATARALDQRYGLGLDEDALFAAAMAAEAVFHGNASGLDPAVALHGGLLRFERGTPPQVRQLRCPSALELVIAQVEAGADTRRMVEGVAALRAAHPGPVDALFASIAAIVASAEAALARGEQERIGALMDLNHGALCALGVSTPALDAACHAARAAGALGAKLTGAGGGGCMIALVPSHQAAQVARALQPGSLHLLRTPLTGMEKP